MPDSRVLHVMPTKHHDVIATVQCNVSIIVQIAVRPIMSAQVASFEGHLQALHMVLSPGEALTAVDTLIKIIK